MHKIFTAIGLTATMAAAPSQAQEVSGTAEAWAQWVGVTNGLDDGSSCDVSGYEFCSNVTGGGAYLGGLIEFAGGPSIYADFTYDQHRETSSRKASRDDSARYSGLGIHYISGSEEAPWGLFATYIEGNNHADSDVAVPLYGIGAEKAWGPAYIQAGYMKRRGLSPVVDEDGIEHMSYLVGGYRWALATGTLDLSGVLGGGNFEERGSSDRGRWLQASLRYEAPLAGRASWFAAYQGDFVRVEETENNEHAFFHAMKVGITIPLGKGNKSPFRTPNFRAPVVNAGEMN